MISSVSTRQDPEQTQKLSVMEEELNNLRLQIAMLVEAQEQINKSQSKYVMKTTSLCRGYSFLNLIMYYSFNRNYCKSKL